MNRRRFIAGGCGCGFSLAVGVAYAQVDWKMPARFTRPDVASDEGGLWAIMDREESRLRRSPFVLREPQIADYVQDMACRLAGDHCPDIRVQVVRNPMVNAGMAPNGMMQVWTGLMLRSENEAQLAAVLGHEIGHYLQRHQVDRLRQVKSQTAVGQFLGVFGLVGALGQLAMAAGLLAYSRDQEREADQIGLTLMRQAGYDPAEASKVWGNLLLEAKARPDGDTSRGIPIFATHPAADERQETLKLLAAKIPGGASNAETWREKTRPFQREWLSDEIRRGQHEESIALITR